MRDNDNILQPIEPQGAPDARGQLVEWRYIAVRQGAVMRIFAGRTTGRPEQKTPHFVMAQTYTITVM